MSPTVASAIRASPRLRRLRSATERGSRCPMLTVEHAGDRLGTARERRMRGDVVDEVAFHPELTLRAAKSFEKFFAGDRGHLAREDRWKAGGCQAASRAQGL